MFGSGRKMTCDTKWLWNIWPK